MHKLIVVTITCGVIVFAKLPPYMHKCSIKDTNFNTCALNSAKQAIPHIIKGDRKFKIPVLDPLFITEMQATSQDFEGAIYNSTAVGFKDFNVERVGFDFDTKEITIQGQLPYLNFTGTYRLSGKLASLPIFGNGPYTSDFFNLTVHFKATYDLKKLDDGKVYMMFSDYDCQFIPRRMVCRMENLFNGNKQLGDAMNTFLNENWRLIYNEVGKDLSMSLGQLVLGIIKESATSVPYNEIFDDVE